MTMRPVKKMRPMRLMEMMSKGCSVHLDQNAISRKTKNTSTRILFQRLQHNFSWCLFQRVHTLVSPERNCVIILSCPNSSIVLMLVLQVPESINASLLL